jgi:hypothetical protein
MKNKMALLVFCSLFQMVSAQSYIPTITNNTAFNYSCKLHGQTRTLTLTTKIVKDTLLLNLETIGLKNTIVTMQEGIKNGNALSFIIGEDLDVMVLKPTETFFMISQSAYQDLQKNNKFIYNNTTYILEENADKNSVVIQGKSVDTLHVVAEIDETEMWIVKNPDFPFIFKMTKNPLGINFTLVKIVDN